MNRIPIRLDQIMIAIFFLLMGLLSDVLGNLISNGGGEVLTWILALVAVFGVIALVVTLRRKDHLWVDIRSPITLRRTDARELYARRGLVVCVSLYNPMKSQTARLLSPTERLDAARVLDHARLDLENSNLQPAIEAIVSHASRLEHCWLVGTTAVDEGQTGSLPFIPVLIKYLREVKGLTCSFHGDSSYAVSLDDDALVAIKTRNRIEAIFDEANRLGLKPKDMVADFTGCPRSMTLGLILACLDGSRDIQFAGTHYNERGEPVGDLFPILFDFEPRVDPAR